MILTGLLVICLLSYSQADTAGNSDDEIPFVIASKDNVGGPKTSNLLPSSLLPTGQSPSNRGRSDIEIETVDEPFGGYVYPKPSRPFHLPTFMTLDANPGLSGFSSFNSEGSAEEIERAPRSPQRPFQRPSFYPPPRPRPLPNFPSGWTYPGIRPLPALYGRPQNF